MDLKDLYTFKELVRKSELPDYTVRYRVDKLHLGREIHDTLFLYSDEDLEKVKNYPEEKL